MRCHGSAHSWTARQLNMKEIQKPVRRSSLVILSLFAAAVAGSGVAQAQQCFARRASGSPNAVRAEGMTERLGGMELLCTGGQVLALPLPKQSKSALS